MQGINILLISELGLIPICDIIVQDSSLNVQMGPGVMEVEGQFGDLVAYDLTNYPDTVVKRQLEIIKPQKFFGKRDLEAKQAIVRLKFASRDPEFFNIGEELSNAELEVQIENIEARVYLQQILRVLSFLTDQLLPSLSPAPPTATSSGLMESQIQDSKFRKISQLQHQTTKPVGKGIKMSYKERRQHFINVYKPFWPKLDIKINDISTVMPIHADKRLRVKLETLDIRNSRRCDKQRLLFQKKSCEYRLDGIFVDTYSIDIGGINLKIEEEGLGDVSVTNDLSLLLNVDMALQELDYKALFKPQLLHNHGERYFASRGTQRVELD